MVKKSLAIHVLYILIREQWYHMECCVNASATLTVYVDGQEAFEGNVLQFLQSYYKHHFLRHSRFLSITKLATLPISDILVFLKNFTNIFLKYQCHSLMFSSHTNSCIRNVIILNMWAILKAICIDLFWILKRICVWYPTFCEQFVSVLHIACKL